MKIRTLSAATLFLAFAAFSTYAQGTRPAGATTPATNPVPVNTAVPDSKIVFVDTEAFADPTAGVARFVSALKSLQAELKPDADGLQTISAKLEQITKDIDTLSKANMVDEKSIQAKRDEGERLQREGKYKKEDYEARAQKRYREVVGPVSADIGKELDAFAKQRGITMILDISKLMPAVLSANPEMDMTKAFIAYYNAKNPATAAATKPR